VTHMTTVKEAGFPASPALEAVIFDAEGVVVDTEGAWDLAQEELLARRGLAYDRDMLKPLLTGRSSMDGARLLVQLYDLTESAEAIEAERRALVKVHLGEGIKFVDGFLDFYDRVRGLYQTGLATAMDVELLRVVDMEVGLSSLFQGIVVALDEPGVRGKPDPDLFLLAAKRLEVSPDACLVIEDAPYGVESARRAGMWVIGLATTYPAKLLADADLVVSGYDELRPTDLADQLEDARSDGIDL
jgi:beta-phosphoglucomutase